MCYHVFDCLSVLLAHWLSVCMHICVFLVLSPSVCESLYFSLDFLTPMVISLSVRKSISLSTSLCLFACLFMSFYWPYTDFSQSLSLSLSLPLPLFPNPIFGTRQVRRQPHLARINFPSSASFCFEFLFFVLCFSFVFRLYLRCF